MIKIVRTNLDDLAEEHYRFLKPKIENELIHNGGPVFKFLKKNLEVILKGTPEQLQTEIIDKFPRHRRKTHEKLSTIFDYDNFTERKRYGAYRLAQNLNVKTCPYCNRLYTFTLDPKSGKARPEFDHFYNKAEYPYLALSFYNLIPSCHVCNSNLKREAEFSIKTHVNPYVEGFNDDIKFRIRLESKKKPNANRIAKDYGIGFFYGSLDSFSIKLKVDKPLTEKEERSNAIINCFKLEELYNQHKDYVVEIVQKAIIYNSDYMDELCRLFPQLFHERNDVKRMILSNYTSEGDLDKRVLSKLTKDVSEEFGLV